VIVPQKPAGTLIVAEEALFHHSQRAAGQDVHRSLTYYIPTEVEEVTVS